MGPSPETWHYRLQQALEARRLDWPDLFSHLKGHISKPSVYAWKTDAKTRSTMMDGDNAALVCAWLNISPVWLFHGEGKSGLEDKAISDRERIAGIYESLTPERKLAAEQMLMGFAALEKAELDARLIGDQKSAKAQKA